MSKKFIVRLIMALAAGALLLASLRLPLWHMRMEAPQYRGKEALRVFVLPGSLHGDLKEIKVLNQYIGVSVPETLPQTRWLPGVLCIAAAFGIVGVLSPSRIRRYAVFSAAGLPAAAMVCAAVQAQVQMYRIGHDRNHHTALVGIKDFTPPLLGTRKLAQFELESQLGPGSFAIGAAVVLYAMAGIASREKKVAASRVASGAFVSSAQPISDYAI